MCNFGSFEAFDDDIVPIITNDHHCHDRNSAKDPTKASIKFANEWTPHPKIRIEGIDEHQWSLRKHDSGIRNGQIDNEHVGRGPQTFGRKKDVDDKAISEKADKGQEKEENAKHVHD